MLWACLAHRCMGVQNVGADGYLLFSNLEDGGVSFLQGSFLPNIY